MPGPVMPRKRHVSRNMGIFLLKKPLAVMPRKRHVSRNAECDGMHPPEYRHASQEACE